MVFVYDCKKQQRNISGIKLKEGPHISTMRLWRYAVFRVNILRQTVLFMETIW